MERKRGGEAKKRVFPPYTSTKYSVRQNCIQIFFIRKIGKKKNDQKKKAKICVHLRQNIFQKFNNSIFLKSFWQWSFFFFDFRMKKNCMQLVYRTVYIPSRSRVYQQRFMHKICRVMSVCFFWFFTKKHFAAILVAPILIQNMFFYSGENLFDPTHTLDGEKCLKEQFLSIFTSFYPILTFIPYFFQDFFKLIFSAKLFKI